MFKILCGLFNWSVSLKQFLQKCSNFPLEHFQKADVDLSNLLALLTKDPPSDQCWLKAAAPRCKSCSFLWNKKKTFVPFTFTPAVTKVTPHLSRFSERKEKISHSAAQRNQDPKIPAASKSDLSLIVPLDNWPGSRERHFQGSTWQTKYSPTESGASFRFDSPSRGDSRRKFVIISTRSNYLYSSRLARSGPRKDTATVEDAFREIAKPLRADGWRRKSFV